MTYADIARPAARPRALTYDIILILAGSLLVALSAQVAVPLPFTPVPITGQTFGVLLVGVLLGGRRGAMSILAYLTQGMVGLPVFAGGAGGPARLLGPTGGYLLGFVAAAWITGTLAERGWDRTPWRAAAAMTAGTAAIFACGLAQLAAFVGTARVIELGLLPFLPGAAIKIALAAALLPSGWSLLRRLGIDTADRPSSS